MTVTLLPAPKLRLARLLDRPGGVSVAEALERAEAGLAQLADPWREALEAALVKVESAGRALLRGARDAEALGALYAVADEAAGLSGPADQPEVGAAAFSLCELIDRCQAGAAIRPAAVRVHLDALTLLRRPAAETGGDAGRRAVLDGLSRLVRGI